MIKSHDATCRQWHLSQITHFQRNSCTTIQTGTFGFICLSLGKHYCGSILSHQKACFTQAPGEGELLWKASTTLEISKTHFTFVIALTPVSLNIQKISKRHNTQFSQAKKLLNTATQFTHPLLFFLAIADPSVWIHPLACWLLLPR